MSQFNYLDNQRQDLPPEGVIEPGTYGDATHIPQLIINSRGIIVGVNLIEIQPGSPGNADFDTADFADADFLTG